MQRKSLELEVIPTPGFDYRGKPYTHPSFRFWDIGGSQHEGCPQFAEIAKSMGFDLKPGDLIKVTIESH